MIRLAFNRIEENRTLKIEVERFLLETLEVMLKKGTHTKKEDNFSGKMVYFLFKDKVLGRRIGEYAEISAQIDNSLYAACLFIYEVIYPLHGMNEKAAFRSGLEYIVNNSERLIDNLLGREKLQKFSNLVYCVAWKKDLEKLEREINMSLERIRSK